MTACKKHDEPYATHVDETTAEVGEELIKFTGVPFEHVYKASALKDEPHCIMCGNDGGRNDTFKYFLITRYWLCQVQSHGETLGH